MRSIEFIINPIMHNGQIVEDISSQQEEHLRRLLLSNPALFEDSNYFIELQNFIKLHEANITPIVGNYYIPISIKSVPVGKVLSIMQATTPYKFIEQHQGYWYFESLGNKKRFPEGEMLAGDQLQHTLLFVTDSDKDHFILLLTTKFSDWKISIHELI